jgi:multidrug resistance efflux pump
VNTTATESVPTPTPVPVPAPAPESTQHWRPKPLRPIVIAGIVGFAIASIIAILVAWRLPPFHASEEKTENAYVRGRTTVIASQVSGYVVAVPVWDYERMSPGQVLVRVDDRPYQARVAQARANVGAAEASLANNAQAQASGIASIASQNAALESDQAQLLKARADMAREDELVGDGSVSIRERDQTLATLRQAEAQLSQGKAAVGIAHQNLRTVEVARGGLEAQVEAARAQLIAAQIDLDHTTILAPEEGQLGEVGVRLGQYVTSGTTLMSLVPADKWVIGDFKEAQTAHMAPGQEASFTVDALDGARLNGHVERLSPAAESEFAVLKPDNATGNFIKVPQRIGVRVVVDPGQPLASRLRPGMSVELRVNTRDGP